MVSLRNRPNSTKSKLSIILENENKQPIVKNNIK